MNGCQSLAARPLVDYEALADQNNKLKYALNRATGEVRRYKVSTTRLEEELLRADRKIDLLLTEIERAPERR